MDQVLSHPRTTISTPYILTNAAWPWYIAVATRAYIWCLLQLDQPLLVSLTAINQINISYSGRLMPDQEQRICSKGSLLPVTKNAWSEMRLAACLEICAIRPPVLTWLKICAIRPSVARCCTLNICHKCFKSVWISKLVHSDLLSWVPTMQKQSSGSIPCAHSC